MNAKLMSGRGFKISSVIVFSVFSAYAGVKFWKPFIVYVLLI